MNFYTDKNTPQSRLFGFIVGVACAVTIVLTLEACIAFYTHAEFATFNVVALIAGIGGFAAYSDVGRHSIEGKPRLTHSAGTILRRWAAIYLMVMLGVYLSKSSATLSRVVMLAWLLATPVTLYITCKICAYAAMHFSSSKGETRTAVFVCFNQDAQHVAENFVRSKILGVTPLGFFDDRQAAGRIASEVPRLGDLQDSVEWIKNNPVDMVFVGLVQSRNVDLVPIIDALHDSVASLYFVPESRLFGMRNIQFGKVLDTPVLIAYETPFLGLSRLLKRTTDIIISGILLLLLSPIMLVIAAGVKLSSPGPVIFKQKRYGIGGQQIDVYKFRSMRNDPLPPPDGVIRQATFGDPRVTPFGAFLRRSSLDELPQFLNVLEGAMSIVGPRPHAVQHNEMYRKLVKGYMLRHKVKPGITGWAQVNGLRGETDTLDKMTRRIEYDLYYIHHWSLELDFRIIARTVGVVFRDRHAY